MVIRKGIDNNQQLKTNTAFDHRSLREYSGFNMVTSVTQYKLLISIGFLSAAIIAFQIALIQILSIVQWHHFAYMVISIAMLGFGAAGTVLAIFREKLTHIAAIRSEVAVFEGVVFFRVSVCVLQIFV